MFISIIPEKIPELLISVIGIVVASLWAYKTIMEDKKNKKHFYWDFFTS